MKFKKAVYYTPLLLDQDFGRIIFTFSFENKDTSKLLSWKVKCTLCVVDKCRSNLIRGLAQATALTQASGFHEE